MNLKISLDVRYIGPENTYYFGDFGRDLIQPCSSVPVLPDVRDIYICKAPARSSLCCSVQPYIMCTEGRD